jgi:preprotein translocase subunit YajC
LKGGIIQVFDKIVLAAAPTSSAPQSTTPTTGGGDTGILTMIIWLVVIVAIFYFLLIFPQRRQKKSFENLMNNLKKGDTVVTIGGVIGKVTDIKSNTVKVRTGNTEMEVTKRAISSVIKSDGSDSSETKNNGDSKDIDQSEPKDPTEK